jgi:hypothetical protein
MVYPQSIPNTVNTNVKFHIDHQCVTVTLVTAVVGVILVLATLLESLAPFRHQRL